MEPRNQKIFVIAAIGLVIIGLFYSLNSDTIFAQFLDQISAVDWDEVIEREIVKNSIPITLIENTGEKCLVKGEKFDVILNHKYFVRSSELARELQFDSEKKTLVVSCEELEREKSRLNVWYVIPEAPKHATKYEYFITEWEETPRS